MGDHAVGRHQSTTSLSSNVLKVSSSRVPRQFVGTACIENEICKVCQADLSTNPWGSATCYGCAVVDVLEFSHHPFRSLLADWPPSITPPVPHANEPIPTYQATFPPPPLDRKHVLRGGSSPKHAPMKIGTAPVFAEEIF